MSIDSGRIAMSPQKVKVSYLATKPFLFFFRISSPPPITPLFRSCISDVMISNRNKVHSGAVVDWTDHGRIAIVQQEDGLKAAFWCHELDEVRTR